MEMPVKSKVDEISLRPYEFLLPLFEVVVNSILSVWDKHPKKGGLIRIYIEREKQVGFFENNSFQDKEGTVLPAPIKNFKIIDNGLGFDDSNFKSFNTAYSEKNREKGCKGVGRFTVLACFDQMHVKSVYNSNNKQYSREFTFDVVDEVKPKTGNPTELSEAVNHETTITLNNYQANFKHKTAISAKQIASDVIEHCLPFFISESAPTVILYDDLDNKEIVLNDIIKEVIKFDGEAISFKPGKDLPDFKLLVVRRHDARIHRLRLCAHNRVVGRTENLGNLISGFESPFKDVEGQEYCIDAYVTSSFLDSKVNTVRNSFNIPASPEDLFSDELSISGIEAAVQGLIEKKYETVLEKIQNTNLQKIREYILNPKKFRLRYRSLLGRPDLLKKIPSNLSDDKLEEQLHKIKFSLEKDLNNGLKKVFKKGKVEDYEDYSKTVKTLLDQDAQFAKDKLADLVIQRKSVLKVLKKMLRISKDGEYKLEEDLHNLIFPMGQTIDTVPYEYHNLWLLDERLAFHSFVASDKQLRKIPLVENKSQKEPDIMIFDFPWAFSEKEGVMSSMVIFEFKRPGRDMDTGGDRNLDSQILGYFQDLMASKSRDYNGELINLDKTTPKFGYVICDMHRDLIEHNINFNGFRQTPQKTLYKLNDVINLHVEVMSYQQLVEMSEKRHAAFFKELGLENF